MTGSPTSSAAAARRCGPRTSGCRRAAPPHRRAAARGGRAAGAHVDRLLRAARAAPRLAAVRADRRRAGPRAAADPGRARAPLPARRPRRAAARHSLRPRHARAAARPRPPRHARDGRLRPRRGAVQNPLAEALLGEQTQFTGLARSVIYAGSPIPPSANAGRRRITRSIRAATRRRCARRRGAIPRARSELVAALLRRSAEFAALWERHEVAERSDTRKRIAHPEVGLLDTRLPDPDRREPARAAGRLHRRAGTEDAERLAMLAVIGTQSSTTA